MIESTSWFLGFTEYFTSFPIVDLSLLNKHGSSLESVGLFVFFCKGYNLNHLYQLIKWKIFTPLHVGRKLLFSYLLILLVW